MKLLLSSLLALCLVACAAYEPVPADFSGSVALVSDSALPGTDTNRTQLYVLEAIDGRTVTNSIDAGTTQGYGVTPRIVRRKVPIRTMKVALRGTDLASRSIQTLTTPAPGTRVTVAGVVDFTPEADKEYVVRGELTGTTSSVWIEDRDTHRAVTPKIVAP